MIGESSTAKDELVTADAPVGSREADPPPAAPWAFWLACWPVSGRPKRRTDSSIRVLRGEPLELVLCHSGALDRQPSVALISIALSARAAQHIMSLLTAVETCDVGDIALLILVGRGPDLTLSGRITPRCLAQLATDFLLNGVFETLGAQCGHPSRLLTQGPMGENSQFQRKLMYGTHLWGARSLLKPRNS